MALTAFRVSIRSRKLERILVRFRDEYVGNHDARLRHFILNRTRVVGFTQSETSVLAQGGSSLRAFRYEIFQLQTLVLLG